MLHRQRSSTACYSKASATQSISLRRIMPFTAAFVFSVALAACGGPSDDPSRRDTLQSQLLQDATGRGYQLEHPAKRIVSLAPNLTEILFAIGAGDRVIGRTSFCNYPLEARSIAVVSDMQTPNYERLLSLKPDLVLMTFVGNSPAAYTKLADLGLEPFAVSAQTIDGTLAAIDTIGVLVGERDNARMLQHDIRATIDSIGAMARAQRSISVFVVLDRAPLMTVSGGFVNESLTIAGGENIAAGDPTPYPRFSREEVLRRDPEVILMPGDSAQSLEALIGSFPEWSQLRAVRNHRVYTIPADVLFRPGPRLTHSIRQLYDVLHDSIATARK